MVRDTGRPSRVFSQPVITRSDRVKLQNSLLVPLQAEKGSCWNFQCYTCMPRTGDGSRMEHSLVMGGAHDGVAVDRNPVLLQPVVDVSAVARLPPLG